MGVAVAEIRHAQQIVFRHKLNVVLIQAKRLMATRLRRNIKQKLSFLLTRSDSDQASSQARNVR